MQHLWRLLRLMMLMHHDTVSNVLWCLVCSLPPLLVYRDVPIRPRCTPCNDPATLATG